MEKILFPISLYGRRVDCQSFAHSPSPPAAASLISSCTRPSVRPPCVHNIWPRQTRCAVWIVEREQRNCVFDNNLAAANERAASQSAGNLWTSRQSPPLGGLQRERGCICIIDIIIQMRQWESAAAEAAWRGGCLGNKKRWYCIMNQSPAAAACRCFCPLLFAWWIRHRVMLYENLKHTASLMQCVLSKSSEPTVKG